MPAASVSLAAATKTRPGEPESMQMQLRCPESVSVTKSPASPEPGSCNTPGVCHQLSSGFELKHDRLSGDDDVKVNLWR
jgi:hypothetical protein